MAHVFATIKPRLLVEVGTWKGASACFWAKLMRDHAIDGAILCIDTWLGGLEHLLWENEWNIRPYYRHGYPALYYQFLANVMRAGLQDYIVPLPTTSLIGARWMRKRNLVADVIYIDGSHDEDDVYNDLREFWQVLRPAGVKTLHPLTLPQSFTKIKFPITDKYRFGKNDSDESIEAEVNYIAVVSGSSIAYHLGAGLKAEWQGIGIDVSASKTLTTKSEYSRIHVRQWLKISTDGSSEVKVTVDTPTFSGLQQTTGKWGESITSYHWLVDGTDRGAHSTDEL